MPEPPTDVTSPPEAQGWFGRARRMTRSVSFLMVASGMAFIIVANGLVGYGVWRQRSDAVDRARASAVASAVMVETQTRAALDDTVRIIDDVEALIAEGSLASPQGRGRLERAVSRWAAVTPHIESLAITSEDGADITRAGHSKWLPLASSTEREPTIHPIKALGVRMVTEMGHDGGGERLALRLDRPARDDAGHFTGLISVQLDDKHLHRQLDERAAPPGTTIALLANDDRVVSMDPPVNPLMKRHASEWRELGAALETAVRPDIDRIIEGRDGPRVVAAQRVTGFPLTVVVIRDLDAALSEWRRDAAAWVMIGIAMTAVIAFLTLHVFNHQRQGERDRDRIIEASQRIRGILDSMVDAVITADERGVITTFNPAAERMFGFGEEQIVGQSINLLVPMEFHHHHRDLTRPGDRATPKVIGVDREVSALRHDGSTFPVTLAVSAVEAGGRRLVVGVVRDITQRKRFEAELIASRGQAEIANRAKTEFLANMSHELRTPLNAIIGFSEILDSEFYGKLNERQRGCAKDIHDSGQRLLEIVNAVLDMSKIEAGNYELNEEVVDPIELIARALAAVRDRAQGSDLELINRADRSVPPRIWGDPRALRQSLLNLLSNAIKFTPSGGIVTVGAAVGEDGALAISVRDTGIGIPPECVSVIFEPFRQAETATNRTYEGTGLGLSIARNYVELHGGELTCESAVGVGTTMTIRIPASRLINDTPDIRVAGGTGI